MPRNHPETTNQFSETTNPPSRMFRNVCRDFTNGRCYRGGRCRYPHGGATKTPVCSIYRNGGICPDGNKCVYLHPDFSRQPSNEPRKNFAVDVAGKNAVSDAHLYYKTRLCRKWLENGFCNSGPTCRYAHGESDLRAPLRSTYGEGSGTFSADETVKHEPANKATTSLVAAAKVVADSLDRPTKKPRHFGDFATSKKINTIYGDWIDPNSESPSASPRGK